MKQEDKELLLKDLCSRLPYGVIIKHKDEHGKSIDARLVGYNGDWFNYYIDDLCFHLKIHEFKPYLRPMSSMTEKERMEFTKLFSKWHDDELFDYFEEGVEFSIWKHKGISAVVFDWLNAHHFDYRGLIEKGLAIEAPEGMY